MSVTATIDDPQSDEEREFNVPVCNEYAYRDFIKPRAMTLELTLCVGWGTMTEVDSTLVPEFIRQIGVLVADIQSAPDVPEEMKEHFEYRFDNLLNRINVAVLKRSDVAFTLG
ncbi:hypothetical protein [Lysobacter capsici]|uniref:hypothetical protein n=1 Tax=Lysobacter capsici TaxID=435897 RepID=UPI000627D59D|nr:hypothetical protein [Lysobacter capsici]